MNGYHEESFPSFGSGLNLRDKEDAVSEAECIDALNVVFTAVGSVRQRDGYDAFTTSTLTNEAGSIEPVYYSNGDKQLVLGCDTRLEVVESDGSLNGSPATGLTSGIWDFARFGAPGSEYVYAGQGDDTLRRWDGSAWTAPASMPAGGALAVMSVDQGNRLVNGRFNTTTGGPTGGAGTSNPSRVYFSDQGAPETWGANNFVDFHPGDGEKVQGIIRWREFIFVFKESKYFVIYGSDEDANGDPIFLWTPYDNGVGLVAPRALCAGTDGVYFLDRRGVYRTTGQDPELVSDIVDPIFTPATPPTEYYTGGTLQHSQIDNVAMAWHDEKVYLAFTSSEGSTVNDRILVYDTVYNWWSLFDIPAACLASFRVSDEPELVFGYATGDNHIGRHAPAFTNDDGVAIVGRWRSGWFDYGSSDSKTIREAKIWATGKVGVALSADFEVGTGALTQLDFTDPSATTWGGSTWGGGAWESPTGLLPRVHRRAIQGTAFSTSFENNILDQSFSVHRLTHHLREFRIPSHRQRTEGT